MPATEAPPERGPDSEPVTVVRVIARLNVGGPAIHTVLLTAGLNDQGFRSTLVTGLPGKEEGDMTYFARQCGVEPVVIPEIGRELSWRDDWTAFVKLLRLLRELRPQIVHTHTAKAGAVGRLAGLIAGVPIRVHTFHGHVFRGYFGPLKTQMFLWIERFLAWGSDRIVAISERQKHDLCRVFRVAPESRCSVIPLGFNLQPFVESDRLRGRLRAELGVAAGRPLVGIVGRLVPIKNHRLFLEVARRVAGGHPDAVFVIVGDGELRAPLQRQAQELGLAERVRFLGWRAELDAVYADLDVVVLTSLNEGTPVALIEAMACGRPVVATDVGGVGDVVEEGATGLLAPSEDADALAAAVTRLLADESLRARFGERGRASAVERYGSERLVEDVRRLYVELLSRKGLRKAAPTSGATLQAVKDASPS